jgi:diguanylate cyclase (GGDEF)-like protein
MTAVSQEPGGADSADSAGTLRRGAAALLCLLLLGAAVVLCMHAAGPRWSTSAPALAVVALLAPVYYAAHRFSVDFELRSESHSVTLVHLPLGVGALLMDPLSHLTARMLSLAPLVLAERQPPLKALYNVATAAFEVGTAAFAVGLVGPEETGPTMWLALYVGLVTGDVIGALVLNAVWRLLGMPVSLRDAVRSLVAMAPITALFTALTIVALSAVRLEPATAVVVLGLAAGLGLAYRAHRKVLAQQQATERLYEFVKDLGPVELDSGAAGDTLERMRVLLHAERLDLALRQGGASRHLRAQEGRSPVRLAQVPRSPVPSPTLRGAVLASSARGDRDTMMTPLLSGDDLAGVLTATGRLGVVRAFDIRDLRLLETVGAELAIALERGRLLADLEQSATTDSLTGLPNLPETTRRLDALLAEGRRVVAALVGIDSFREVNDTLGHEVGDALVLEVARRLRRTWERGLVGRLSGSRLLVVVDGALVDGDAEAFGLNLRAAAEGPAQVGPVGTDVRLSVGVVVGPAHGGSATTLLRRAGTAMTSARRTGGGPVVWEPAYEVEGTRRLAVVMAMREALAVGAIGVVFQPKVGTTSLQVTGFEALARWTHPALGPVEADEFVPLAETSGLIAPLTASVLRQSLAACTSWQLESPGVGVSVNISADTVLDPTFVTQVARALAETRLRPGLLTLELTESVLMEPQLAAERMGELRRLGVRLSVDDFGTGYSSLTYLRGLPVDEVKVDKSFVDAVTSDPADRAVVRAVVEIAHVLGMRVVAEGVESADQHSVLHSLGVDEVQGYLHSRPLAGLEVAAWLVREARTTS